MKLLIVESPAKAKTISKYLDNKYTVRASIGHIRDLPKSNKEAIDIEGGFIPHYEISKGKEKVVSELKDLSKKADEVILATDPDREGEAIAWHIAETLGLKHPKRVTFHEITESAVKEAMKNPRDIDQDLRKAQEARRVLDRLVGYDLSGLIWKKVRYGLSAGRVQSPALRIVMEREREIKAFISRKFWVITADTKTEKKESVQFTYSKEADSEAEAKRVISATEKSGLTVADVREENTLRRPKAPFTTSTLQQTASSRLGYAPSRTMKIAQKLYEHGLITYMRTDSTALSKDAVAEMEKAVKKKFGAEYWNPQEHKTKVKNAQEAHEAVRPTHIEKETISGMDEEQNLYNLIWERAVSSQMSDAKLLKTKIIAKSADPSVEEFHANGSRTLFAGWLALSVDSRGEDVELPKVNAGEKLSVLEMRSEEKETEPPGRYSEAGLIKELEKRGIGRPSTYASILRTLVDRGYVDKENKSLKPTDTGEVVSNFLEENFSEIIGDVFTAQMEEDLDEIANGKKDYEKTLKSFYGPFKKLVDSKAKIPKVTNLGEADKKFKCPKCGEGMIIKLGKSGKFLSCSKFPDCEGGRTIDGEEMKGPTPTGEKCPECKDGNLVERKGKYGTFIGCDQYPKCKFIKNDENAEQRGKTGVMCPECKSGEITERHGKFGLFYSCSGYPKCKFAIKAKPTGKICDYIKEGGEKCGKLMMEGTKTIPERCSDKYCPNHNPHKLHQPK